MVNVGIIGLGPHWYSRYRPALDSLRHRVKVSAVYDPVAGRADHVALELGAVAYHGLSALACSSVRALLLLDSSWHGPQALHLLCAAGKPIYVVSTLGNDAASLKRLYDTSAADGLTLMPELSRRYAPTTHRLKELIATKIGKPRLITVEAAAASQQGSLRDDQPAADILIGLLDWCRYVAGSAPVSVFSRDDANPQTSESVTQTIDIEFAERVVGGSAPVAQLRFHETPLQGGSSSPEVATPTLRQEIECERGTAVVTSPIEISWSSDSGSSTERLTTERPDVEVMLDHFTRRVVGGLIPVADLRDVYDCISLIRAAEESRRTGAPVSLNGHE